MEGHLIPNLALNFDDRSHEVVCFGLDDGFSLSSLQNSVKFDVQNLSSEAFRRDKIDNVEFVRVLTHSILVNTNDLESITAVIVVALSVLMSYSIRLLVGEATHKDFICTLRVSSSRIDEVSSNLVDIGRTSRIRVEIRR